MPSRTFATSGTTTHTAFGDLIYEQFFIGPQDPRQEMLEFMFKDDVEVKEKIGKKIKELTSFKPKPSRVFNYIFWCRHCRKNKNKSEMARITDRKYMLMCKNCAQLKGFSICPNCKGYYADRHCPCQDKKNSDQVEINRYNYQADWKPFRLSDSDVYLFGIEFEVELNGESVNKLRKIYDKDWIVFKWDGSLSDRGSGGVEIVTMPLGWEWMKKNENELMDLFNITELGIKARLTNTCGMHIHINKDIFTDRKSVV